MGQASHVGFLRRPALQLGFIDQREVGKGIGDATFQHLSGYPLVEETRCTLLIKKMPELSRPVQFDVHRYLESR